ncbi:MAG: hypothetical protein ABIQ74_12755 [Chitinophagales bacterium]
MKGNSKSPAISSSNERIRFLRDEFERLLPPLPCKKMVWQREQQKQIRILKATLIHEQFFYVADLREGKLKNVNFIEKWLGYPDQDFTIEKFMSLIHPSQQLAFKLLSYNLAIYLLGGKMKLQFMVQYFIFHVALRHIKGHYLLFKRVTYPFQFTDKNQLLEYLTVFTLLGGYQNTPFYFRASDQNGDLLDMHLTIIENMQTQFKSLRVFSTQEWRILTRYAKDININIAMLSQAFQVKESTIKEYNKRIKEKASNIFERQFTSTREVAAWLAYQGIL